jgi:hypothetical protein
MAVQFDPEIHCGADTKASTPCKQRKGARTSHTGVGRCWKHGGASPQAEFAGQLVIARQEAQVMGVPLAISPVDAMLQLIEIAAGEVRYCSERVAELEDKDAAGPVKTVTMRPRKEAGGAEGATNATEIQLGPPALHVWIRARNDAMDRLFGYTKAAIAIGIAERRVRIAEGQAQMIAEAMRRFAVAMGHDPSDPKVREGMRGSLTVIAGGAA